MSTWEERMAQRAKERARYREAEARATGTDTDADGSWGGFEMGFISAGVGPDIAVSHGYGVLLSRRDEMPERKRCGVPLAVESDRSPLGIMGIVYCMEQRGHDGQHRNTCLGSGPVLWDDLPTI